MEHTKETLIEKINLSKYLLLKRLFDVLLALILLIPVVVVIIVFSILIKLDSKGPVFYIHNRVGKNMKPFGCIKLRSMKYNPDDKGLNFTSIDDDRITRVGKVIRRFRIDELPQLFNILMNQMSWIGPRPLTQKEYDAEDEFFQVRSLVHPGITGLAQVQGGNDLTNRQKLDKDLIYLENLSLKEDIKIVWLTIKVIFNGDGAR